MRCEMRRRATSWCLAVRFRPAPRGSNWRAALFLGALGAAFAFGTLVGKYRWFPYSVMADVLGTFRAELASGSDDAEASTPVWFEVVPPAPGMATSPFRAKFGDVRPESAAANRIELFGGNSLGGPVLWFGGPFQFLDYCPEWGCLAVEYAANGALAHAYPYRPAELERAWTAGLADEDAGDFGVEESFLRELFPYAMHRYDNGDLLTTFLQAATRKVPRWGGVARIDRDGRPIWVRHDHSHHWAQLEADGTALVPAVILGEPAPPDAGHGVCKAEELVRESVNYLSEDGSVRRRIDLLDALLQSPYARAMRLAHGFPRRHPLYLCSHIWLNFASRLRADAGGAWGVAPGDIVASMRGLSAFALLDAQTGTVKRVVRGSFRNQHSVQHLEGSKFLLFDNLGGDGRYGPSRVLVVDLADGRETTLFPNDRTPEHLQGLFTRMAGHISISPDRGRAIAAFTRAGVAVEISLPGGEVLATFHSLHDVSDVETLPEQRKSRAAAFPILGVEYVRPTAATP